MEPKKEEERAPKSSRIKPLEIGRDGGGKAPDFTLFLAAYQPGFADGLVLAKGAQTQCRSPKPQGGSLGGWGCFWAKPSSKMWLGEQRACGCQGHVWQLLPRALASHQEAIPHSHSSAGIQSVPRESWDCFTPGKVKLCAWRSPLLLSRALQKLSVSYLLCSAQIIPQRIVPSGMPGPFSRLWLSFLISFIISCGAAISFSLCIMG